MNVVRDHEIRQLYRKRSLSPFLRWSGLALVTLVALAWSSESLRGGDFFSERRLANLERFLGELRPFPLQGQPFDVQVALAWAADLMAERGWQAIAATLAISVAAIVLAALGGFFMSLAAARTLASPEPYVLDPLPPSWVRRAFWKGVVASSRGLLILLRSIPEYVWAFLLLAVFGPTAWPIVLALAVHNLGILGKLDAEVVENLDPQPLQALRGLGASRMQIILAGVFPLSLPRFLLFFFYRWESCVREATVLGMLGIASLGFWIVDARARNHYDEMFFFVLLGAGIVVVGDLVSAFAREVVRRAA